MSKDDKGSWAIGGGAMIGIGVGFFYIQTNVFAFVGSIMVGIGLGLVAAAIISKCKCD
jgi:hypothetical protein